MNDNIYDNIYKRLFQKHEDGDQDDKSDKDDKNDGNDKIVNDNINKNKFVSHVIDN